MSKNSTPTLSLTAPIFLLGRRTIEMASYFGGLGILLTSTTKSLRSRDQASTFRRDLREELHWMFALGLPLIGLIHIGLGSFLALQGYYGGTFVEGTGAVVGVGLIRNVAPLMACQVLSIIIAARMTPEIRRDYGVRDELPSPRLGLLDRPTDQSITKVRTLPTKADKSRAVSLRLFAGAIAGTVMGLWGSAVGTVVGWSVSKTLIGVTSHSFFHMFWEMLWTRDIVGLFVKGSAFGMVCSLFACQEGLRGRADATMPELASSACRAACLAMASILLLNSVWFILFYHAGSAFGPTLLKPPTQ